MMRYSEITLKVLAAMEAGFIKSNAHFWKEFNEKSKFEKVVSEKKEIDSLAEMIENKLLNSNDNEGIISIYDTEFPLINKNVKNGSEKPYILFYKGNLELLKDLNRNVAIIGLTTPEEEIEEREKNVVGRLVERNLVIVSGLAAGCDSIAHKACIDNGGKTIAILPTQINKIYPAINKKLAAEIVESGGLLISEYYKEPKSRYDAVKRFIDRDRLQAMFSKTVILAASYREGDGDSGSRHALQAAKKYGVDRYIMYNKKTDEHNKQFYLNKDEILNGGKVLDKKSIEYISNLVNVNLSAEDSFKSEQIGLL